MNDSTRGWERYLHNTLQIRETNIHALSGFRTRDPTNRAAATYILDRMATAIGQTPSNILYYRVYLTEC